MYSIWLDRGQFSQKKYWYNYLFRKWLNKQLWVFQIFMNHKVFISGIKIVLSKRNPDFVIFLYAITWSSKWSLWLGLESIRERHKRGPLCGRWINFTSFEKAKMLKHKRAKIEPELLSIQAVQTLPIVYPLAIEKVFPFYRYFNPCGVQLSLHFFHPQAEKWVILI